MTLKVPAEKNVSEKIGVIVGDGVNNQLGHSLTSLHPQPIQFRLVKIRQRPLFEISTINPCNNQRNNFRQVSNANITHALSSPPASHAKVNTRSVMTLECGLVNILAYPSVKLN